MLAALPTAIWLLFDAVKFIATQAHGMYGDPRFALWDGTTAVDHAVANIRKVAQEGCACCTCCPANGATGDQFDLAIRLL